MAPQDRLQLSATCSDPEGAPLQYAWTVEQRPAGSTEQVRNSDSAQATFVANTATPAATPYVFKLTASDPAGASGSCEITAFAVPRDALHLQLVWNSDRTDLDLHLLSAGPLSRPRRSGRGALRRRPAARSPRVGALSRLDPQEAVGRGRRGGASGGSGHLPSSPWLRPTQSGASRRAGIAATCRSDDLQWSVLFPRFLARRGAPATRRRAATRARPARARHRRVGNSVRPGKAGPKGMRDAMTS